jgi:hypothetical protein
MLDMELRLNIGINELIGLIRQLPHEQKLLIKKEVESGIKTLDNHRNSNDLTEFLLSGPTMTKEEDENFKKLDKDFNKWTKNLSA